MKHHLSGRKRFLAFALAAVFALGTAVSGLAETTNLDGLNNHTEFSVIAVCDAPTYTVEIAWESMDFHYQYGNGWDYDRNQTFNRITVQNASMVPVGVKFEFTGNGGHTGHFNTGHKDDGDTYQALYLHEATQETFPNAEMYLILDDKCPANPNGTNVGSVTITMVDVVTNGARALTDECGNANIGYVTSASELVPFTEKDLYEH